MRLAELEQQHRSPLELHVQGRAHRSGDGRERSTPVGVVGEHAQTALTIEGLFERAEEPEELVVIKVATHVSLYDHPEQVEEVVEKIDAFWTANVQ